MRWPSWPNCCCDPYPGCESSLRAGNRWGCRASCCGRSRRWSCPTPPSLTIWTRWRAAVPYNCSCSVRPPRRRASSSPRATWRRLRRSAGGSTASRSRWSLLLPGCGCYRCTNWRPGSTTGSGCSPPAPGTRRPGSRRCAPWSTGAGNCSAGQSRRCWAGWGSSRTGSPSPPPKRSARRRRTAPTCSTYWRGWWTARWSSPRMAARVLVPSRPA